MKNRIYRLAAILLSCSLLFSGCGQPEDKKEECPYEEFIVVDVFDGLANYQGVQSGWFAKLVKDKFNMELNIIAPNVAGGGDTLFETRAAAGDIGDLIICSGESGNLPDMVTAGLVTLRISRLCVLKRQSVSCMKTFLKTEFTGFLRSCH